LLTALKEGTTELIFPTKGIKATCPDCGKPLITKMGTYIVHHFAHYPDADCDSMRYSDGMTPWHRAWQNKILNPIAGINIEVPYPFGDYHKRADLKTPSGLIVEFQHSSLPVNERFLREKCYKNMIWIIHPDIEFSRTWETYSNCLILIDRENYLERYNDTNHIKLDVNFFIKKIINGLLHPSIIFKKREREFNNPDLGLFFWFYNSMIDPRPFPVFFSVNIKSNIFHNENQLQHSKDKTICRYICSTPGSCLRFDPNNCQLFCTISQNFNRRKFHC